jgi:tetratricopeptide (TPR) repeat protein
MTPHPRQDDSYAAALDLEHAYDRFEAAWRAGGRPRVEDFLAGVPAEGRSALVRELVLLDRDHRRLAGESPAADEYRARFPEAGDGWWAGVFAAPTGDPSTATHAADTGLFPAGCGPAAAPGVVVGGYELVEELARGGMGEVYRARDRSLDRDVAVKLLQDRYPPDSPAARRFAVEAHITAQLQHPGIPAVHQIGTLPDGRPFLAMKLVRGRTLDELLKGRPDPSADRGRFLAIFEQVCQAVGYAHAHQVLHRDLKPSNVMVGAFGEVQVMDWGLAKLVDPARPEPARPPAAEETWTTRIVPTRDADSATEAGSLLGTPAYMPPEQAAGAVGQVGPRADVFGLGALLCVVLTGKPPYTGDPEAVRLQAVQGRLAAAYERLDACVAEPDLVSLCKRCLAADPADRPQDAGEVAAAVAALRAAAEDRARRAELDRARAEVRAAEQRKRRRVHLALLGAVMLLAAGGGAFAWWRDRQATARETERRVAAARDRAAAALALDQAEAALGKDNPVYGEIDAALTQAERRLAGGGPDDLQDRLAELTKARRMLDRLDAIDVQRWSVSRDNYLALGWASAQAAYPAAFRDHGLDVAAEPPDVVADKVRRSPIAARLTAALDDWLEVGGPAALLAVAGRLDPDPGRAALRRALTVSGATVAGTAGDQAGIAGRVAGLDGGAVPPAFAAFVGGHERTPEAEAVRLLRSAQAAHPDYFALAVRATLRSPRADDKIAYYRIALALRPANVVCHTHLGIALADKGDLGGAVAEFREAIRLDPGFVLAHHNLGIALYARKDPDGAIAACREAIRLDPKYAPPHNNLGNALRAKKDVDGATAAYREAIRLDPKSAKAHYNLGTALKDKGEVGGAIPELREAIRLDPGFVLAHYNLGIALHDKKDLVGAIAAYREAIRLDPKYAQAHNNLGNALSDKGEVDGAIAAYREAIRLDSKLAPAHYNLGNALSDKGEVDGAIAAYREAIRLDPKYAKAHNNLGIALYAKKDPDGAISEFREAIRLDPTLAPAHYNLGNALRAKKDVDGAIAAYREAIRLDPKYAQAHNNLGSVLCDDKKDVDGAISEFREAIRLDPKLAPAHHNLGNALRARGEVDEAIAAYREAIRLDPKYAKAHYNLGSALLVKGEADGAIAAYTESVRLRNNHLPSYTNLSRLLSRRGEPRAALEVLRQGARVNPNWLADPATGFRYDSARYACLAAAGQGKDAPLPDERPALRTQALDWLTADLEAWRGRLAADPAKNRAAVHRRIADWLTDADLASVREPAELEKLPLDERVSWVKLWTAVRDLRDATAPPEAAPPPRPMQ